MNPVVVRNVKIGEGIPKICVPIVGVTREEILAAGARIRTDGGEALDPRVGRGARWSVPTDRAPAPEAAAGCAVLAGHGGGDQPCGDRLPGAGGKGQEYPPPLAASGTGEKGKAVPGV